jgi:hypothetical protein
VDAHLIEELGGGHRPAVVPQRRLALGVQGFEHVLAVTGRGEAEAGAELPLEEVEERAPGITAGAALGLGEGTLQQTVLCLRTLWTTGHQRRLSLAPTGSSALSQVPLRGCPEPP